MKKKIKKQIPTKNLNPFQLQRSPHHPTPRYLIPPDREKPGEHLGFESQNALPPASP